MSEKLPETLLLQREKKNYIKGLLCEILRDDIEPARVTTIILQMSQVCKGEELQKAILGEIIDYLKSPQRRPQAVAVSVKIAEKLAK